MKQHRYFFLALVVVVACVSCSSSGAGTNDQAEINASVQRLIAAMNAKDINGIMAYYSPDETLHVFDALPPRQYVGATAYRKDFEGFLAAYPSGLHAEVSDWKVETEGNLGYGHGVVRTSGQDKDGKLLDLTLRVTDVYRKINGKWLVIHEHVSWPVDLATGQADLSSKP